MKRKILFIIIDLVVVFLAFLIVAWFKPATRSQVLPFYLDSFFVFLAVWFVSSVVTKKYRFELQKKLIRTFITIFIGNFTVIAIVSILIYAFNLFSYSRIIVFGTVVLSTLFEMTMATIFYVVITARSLDMPDGNSFNEPDTQLKGRLPDKLQREVTRQINGKHEEVSPALKELILEEYGEEVYQFIFQHSVVNGSAVNIVSTTTRFNIYALLDGRCECIVNLHRVNDIQRINKFLEAVNDKLTMDGVFIGKAETYTLRKARILKKFPYPINYLYYIADFSKNSRNKKYLFCRYQG
nr:hypothetical protein [Bacteroidota bacterium]